ncbi:hypothetical protein B0H13DRAFT_1998562, partial [Mycena leptocephala]
VFTPALLLPLLVLLGPPPLVYPASNMIPPHPQVRLRVDRSPASTFRPPARRPPWPGIFGADLSGYSATFFQEDYWGRQDRF